MQQEKAAAIVKEVFSLYQQFGNADYIGEPVSQIEHMCQAAQLAAGEGYDAEVVLAAFFHDIGHLCEFILPVQQMEGYGVVDHEGLGARYLRDKGFSERIAQLVKSHVSAKRYLTYKYPDYFNKLSVASRRTLEEQGGVMEEAEALAFEADPLHELYIKLREWDDRAKEENKPLADIGVYEQMALEHLMKATPER